MIVTFKDTWSPIQFRLCTESINVCNLLNLLDENDQMVKGCRKYIDGFVLS